MSKTTVSKKSIGKSQSKNLAKLREITEHIGGTFKNIGHSRYPGGRLVALEGPRGKAIANFRTVFLHGKPVKSRIVGWVGL